MPAGVPSTSLAKAFLTLTVPDHTSPHHLR
jgi:hypothetical protein